MPKGQHKYFERGSVALLEDIDDLDDLDSLIRTSRSDTRTSSRRNGEYRRSNRSTEDGYGELDFA
jgi:hypothetical protein